MNGEKTCFQWMIMIRQTINVIKFKKKKKVNKSLRLKTLTILLYLLHFHCFTIYLFFTAVLLYSRRVTMSK